MHNDDTILNKHNSLPCQYSIEVVMSPPQVIDFQDKKKSFFHLDRQVSRSPRRDNFKLKETRTLTYFNKKSISAIDLNEFDRKITEKLKSTKNFECFINDPEIEKFIEK